MDKKTNGKIAAGLAVLYLFFMAGWYLNLSGEKVNFVVNSGEGASVVAKDLKKSKLICSEKLFLVLVKVTDSSARIKAGTYDFTQKDGMFRILRELKKGSKNFIKFTVPEGSNIKQTAEIISEKLPINKDKFIRIAQERAMEGYLMPETYFVDSTATEEQVIDMMKNEFDKKVTPDMHERANELAMSMKNIIILASIIEKEAVKPEERTTIAAVFYNRLKKNMRLESCATVLYALGVNKARLSVEDTKINSPYNTYKYFGLTPGPICSPGIESIKAALYPANTSSLYFVAKGDGGHIFSENLDEHVKNKNITKKNIQQKKAAAQKKPAAKTSAKKK